jgi:hypothetical protein
VSGPGWESADDESGEEPVAEGDQGSSSGSDWKFNATYRPLQRRAKWVTGLLVAGIVVDVAAVASGLLERSLLADIGSGELITSDEANTNDVRQLVVGVVQGVIFTLTVVAFLFWFSRAYRNLTAVGVSGLRFGYRWAVGGWFVPILTLWRPKQIANDIWRGSDPDAPPVQETTWRGDSVPKLYLFWWLGFLLSSSLYSVAGRRALRAEGIIELQAVNSLYLTADTIGLLAGILCLLVVRRTTVRQVGRAGRLGLVPQEDGTPVWRRKTAWAVLLATLAAVALQGLITVAAWSGTLAGDESEPAPRAPQGTPPNTLLADDFSQTGVWLVQNNRSFSMDYAGGRYRILMKEPNIRSSGRALREEVDSMSAEVDATFRSGRVAADYYGLTCLTSSRGSYFFGISPDGYYTVAFDPGGDREISVKRLVEDRARRRFSPDHAANRIRATCIREGVRTVLRLDVNGARVAETTHRDSLGRFIGVELFAFSRNGGTDVRFDDLVVRRTTR